MKGPNQASDNMWEEIATKCEEFNMWSSDGSFTSE